MKKTTGELLFGKKLQRDGFIYGLLAAIGSLVYDYFSKDVFFIKDSLSKGVVVLVGVMLIFILINKNKEKYKGDL